MKFTDFLAPSMGKHGIGLGGARMGSSQMVVGVWCVRMYACRYGVFIASHRITCCFRFDCGLWGASDWQLELYQG